MAFFHYKGSWYSVSFPVYWVTLALIALFFLINDVFF